MQGLTMMTGGKGEGSAFLAELKSVIKKLHTGQTDSSSSTEGSSELGTILESPGPPAPPPPPPKPRVSRDVHGSAPSLLADCSNVCANCRSSMRDNSHAPLPKQRSLDGSVPQTQDQAKSHNRSKSDDNPSTTSNDNFTLSRPEDGIPIRRSKTPLDLFEGPVSKSHSFRISQPMILAKSQLYNELNTVLRRRIADNEQQSSNGDNDPYGDLDSSKNDLDSNKCDLKNDLDGLPDKSEPDIEVTTAFTRRNSMQVRQRSSQHHKDRIGLVKQKSSQDQKDNATTCSSDLDSETLETSSSSVNKVANTVQKLSQNLQNKTLPLSHSQSTSITDTSVVKSNGSSSVSNAHHNSSCRSSKDIASDGRDTKSNQITVADNDVMDSRISDGKITFENKNQLDLPTPEMPLSLHHQGAIPKYLSVPTSLYSQRSVPLTQQPKHSHLPVSHHSSIPDEASHVHFSQQSISLQPLEKQSMLPRFISDQYSLRTQGHIGSSGPLGPQIGQQGHDLQGHLMVKLNGNHSESFSSDSLSSYQDGILLDPKRYMLPSPIHKPGITTCRNPDVLVLNSPMPDSSKGSYSLADLGFSNLLDPKNDLKGIAEVDAAHELYEPFYDTEILDDDSELQSCTLPPMAEDLEYELRALDEEYNPDGISYDDSDTSTVVPTLPHSHVSTPQPVVNDSVNSASTCLVKTSVEYLNSLDSLGPSHDTALVSESHDKPSTLVCRVVDKASLPLVNSKLEPWQDNRPCSSQGTMNQSKLSTQATIGASEVNSLTSVTSCENSIVNGFTNLGFQSDTSSSNDESEAPSDVPTTASLHSREDCATAHIKADSWHHVAYSGNLTKVQSPADKVHTKYLKWRKPGFSKSTDRLRNTRRASMDIKSRSLDRFNRRRSVAMKPFHKTRQGGNFYATYPPPRSMRALQSHDQEVIEHLMITHSGDHIPISPGEHKSSSKHISSTVTIPEPTSFHMHGNDVGQHLINPAKHMTFNSEYSDVVNTTDSNMSDFNMLNGLAAACGDSDEDLIWHDALDREGVRSALYHTWTHTAASKAREKVSQYQNWRKSLPGFQRQEARLHGNIRNHITRRAKRSSNRHPGQKFGRMESIQSACTYLSDSGNHSSDADAESVYDTYERSLIEYVKTENLSRISDDIHTMYWHQFDSISTAALPVQPQGFLKKVLSCFICDAQHKHPKYRKKKRCPMTQNVQESGSIRAFGDGLFKGEEDKPATFYVETQGKRGDLFVQVDGPNSIAKCNIEPDRSGRYVVTYVPVEVGLFNVQIKWNNREIEGSPFRPKIIDPRKIHVMGGWQTLLDAGDHMLLSIGETKVVKFDCSDAGPGTLAAEVKGPNGAIIPVDVYSEGRGIFVVSFTPRQQGEHYLSVKYAEVPLPRSPYYGLTKGGRSMQINIEKVVLTGRGLQEGRVGEESEFVIDGTDAGPGTPEVSLTGIKHDIPVQLYQLGQNKYRCVYVPQMPGGYLLTIAWSGRQVRGSPFKVNVTASGDANKVTCSGEGLKMGIMGREIKSVIDTRKAGPGELIAQCQGPTKVAYCELYDHQDGTFMLNIKPQEVGKHVLQIKYDGVHVPGSPYTLRVSGAPDASKVKCYGPGIEDGVLHNFQSHFIVETRGAGAGQLTVRVRGPKGAFRVEMRRESQKDRTIKCQYDPVEIGDYVIHVKWSGEHVPGSPFHVQIFDTNEELDRARMQKQWNS